MRQAQDVCESESIKTAPSQGFHTVLQAISTATQINIGSNSPAYAVLTLLDNTADMPLDFPCQCGVSDVSSREFPQLEVKPVMDPSEL